MVGDYTRRHLIKGGAATGFAAGLGGCLGGGNGNGSTQNKTSTTPGQDTPAKDGNPSSNSNTNTEELYEPEEIEEFVAENAVGEQENFALNARGILRRDLEQVDLTYENGDVLGEPYGEMLFQEIDSEADGLRLEARTIAQTSEETDFSNLNEVSEDDYEDIVPKAIGATLRAPTTVYLTEGYGPIFNASHRDSDQMGVQRMRQVLEDQNGNKEEIVFDQQELDWLEEHYRDQIFGLEWNGAMEQYEPVVETKLDGKSVDNF